MMKLYVGNLADDVDDSQLNEIFLPFGTPESAEVVFTRGTTESRGFGFVELADDEAARAAVAELDGKDLNGRALKVEEARSKGTTLRSSSH